MFWIRSTDPINIKRCWMCFVPEAHRNFSHIDVLQHTHLAVLPRCHWVVTCHTNIHTHKNTHTHACAFFRGKHSVTIKMSRPLALINALTEWHLFPGEHNKDNVRVLVCLKFSFGLYLRPPFPLAPLSLAFTLGILICKCLWNVTPSRCLLWNFEFVVAQSDLMTS